MKSSKCQSHEGSDSEEASVKQSLILLKWDDLRINPPYRQTILAFQKWSLDFQIISDFYDSKSTQCE